MTKLLKILLTGFALAAVTPSPWAQEDSGIKSLSFGDQPELLAPEVAFLGQLDVNPAGDGLILSYTIEEGYYLYRDRFSIASVDGRVILGETQWPKAKIYSDPYFGEQAIYREGLEATIPVNSSSTDSAVVDVTYQGCADLGVCYPPITASYTLTGLNAQDRLANSLTSSSDSGTTDDKVSVLDQLKAISANDAQNSDPAGTSVNGRLFDNNQPEILHPSEAFGSFVETTENGLAVNWNIEPGYYLYKDKTHYSLENDDGQIIEVARTVREEGELYTDEFFGETAIYRVGTTDQLLIAANTEGGAKGSGELTVYYQGCADVGVCFPPESFEIPVSWNASNVSMATASGDTEEDTRAIAAASSSGSGGGGSGGTPLQLSEQDRLASQLASGSLWFNAAAFFVFGLLLAFTPCVLPMVPILSSIILGGGEKQTTSKAFSLSVVYVLGMALTYTIVGVLVGLSGYNIQAWFQNPVILSAFAALFVLFSLAMFGVFKLQLPSGIQTRLMSISNKQSGGRSGGVFVMGILSALIVGPCVTAPLMGALIYIADTGDAWVGATALFALSIGMGTPLLLVGTSAGKWMPKAGGWMSAVNIVFGFMMLAMAIWMLSRFLDPTYVVLLSAALALCAGMWALLEYTKSDNAIALRTVGSAAGVAVGVYGISLLLSAFAGQPNLLKPLHAFGGGGGQSANATQHLTFNRIKSVDDLNAAIKVANTAGKPVMLDFYADWCISCKEMEAFTFTDAQVQAQLDNVELLQADVTANDVQDQALLKHFGLFGPPAIIFYTPAGEEVRNARLVGYLDAKEFAAHLDAVLGANQVASSK